MNSLPINIRVFCALMHREFYGIGTICKESLIDGLVQCGTQIILVCFLFPAIGMPAPLMGPMYIGAILAMLFTTGFSFAFKQLFDLRGARVIDYHLILPLTKTWLMTAYIARAALQMSVATIPFLVVGIGMGLTSIFPIELKPLTFLLIYCLTLICFSTWYQAASFRYELTWFLDNLWPRRIFWLFLFGCLFMPWHSIYTVSPLIGTIFLCNPMTYIAEGWRAALMPAHTYLPLPTCIAALALYTILGIMALGISMHSRLDPV